MGAARRSLASGRAAREHGSGRCILPRARPRRSDHVRLAKRAAREPRSRGGILCLGSWYVFSFFEVTVYLAIDIIVRFAYHCNTEFILNGRRSGKETAR